MLTNGVNRTGGVTLHPLSVPAQNPSYMENIFTMQMTVTESLYLRIRSSFRYARFMQPRAGRSGLSRSIQLINITFHLIFELCTILQRQRQIMGAKLCRQHYDRS